MYFTTFPKLLFLKLYEYHCEYSHSFEEHPILLLTSLISRHQKPHIYLQRVEKPF